MNRSGQLVALLVAVALASPALASQPGQPLDCSDWVFSLPGLSCVQETAAAGSVGKGADAVTDNDGAVWILRPVLLDGRGGWDVNIARHELVRYINGSAEVVASITDRSAPLPEERVRGEYSYCGGNETYCGYQGVKLANSLFFDAVKGELIIYLHSFCWAGYPGACGPNEDIWWISHIRGLTPLFEILQSYTPPPSAIGFRTPAMPEGLGGADHFDTYWGPLTKPIDFTQAHPLQCGYPATPPHVGDYETVSDTLPTPGPDSGYYYLTATTYQGQTRYGRKTSGGKLSGRDPALLPACVQP